MYITSRCTAAWLGATTLTGGINTIVLNRERQRTEEANRRADEAWQQLAEGRKRADERIEALISQVSEEHRQPTEERQVMMDTIAGLTDTIAELRRHNGHAPASGE